MAFVREIAHRVFSQEFNAARAHIQGEGEKDPSFLVTPLGAKVNRLHVVGVCTEVEPVGEAGDVYRCRISDPSGVFTVYAGQYQAEAAQVISELQPPCFIAVTGKARTYEPEPGSVFVSIRPETVTLVDEATRDHWVLTTAQQTLERIQAVGKVREDPHTDKAKLMASGVREKVAEGALLAQEHYGLLDVSGHYEVVKGALKGLLPGGSFETHVVEAAPAAEKPTWTPTAAPAAQATEADAEEEAFDEGILAIVQRLEGEDGARWDDILADAQSTLEAADDEAIEEALNRLMDKGLVYEPTLGVLRST